jgi:pimeloyl-ACP methyl ester carboxylesterase/membrane protein DedA with SNARE-associated domain
MTGEPEQPARRHWKRWVLALYVVLLIASHLVRALDTPDDDVPPGLLFAELEEVDADGARTGRSVRMAYRDSGPRDAPVVIGVHGSPSGGEEFSRIASEIDDDYRVLWMHLPGFGRSTLDIPDYSVRSHALYLEQLVDQLGIERAHLVGFSMGGGVVLELAPLLAERTASLTLLSAIGVQELEWLGDYALNHGVHGLQLAALWVVYELVPHFGSFDGGMLSVEYARNFYDTDQRPLRQRLEELTVPMLVIHGRSDPLVPFDAALEHHRIVPHSRLFAFDGDHFATFTEPEFVAAALREFLDDVEAKAAPTRADATPEQLARATEPFDPSGAPVVGFALIAICAMLALATLVSEDLTCILAGALVAQGRLEFLPAAAACFIGIYIGDLLLFLSGRYLGSKALTRRPLRWFVSAERTERAAEWLERRGLAVIFLSRFTPGMRLPTYFASGALGANAKRFALYFAIAAGVWTPTLVWLASVLGARILEGLEVVQENLLLGLGLTVLAGLFVVKILVPLLSWQGRRRLVGRWRRTVRWEFWPAWLVYVPVVLWLLVLALKHRSATAWCASNPGIEGGGVVGESKARILADLASRAPATEVVPAWVALPASLGPDERVRRFDAFRSAAGLDWPVVLKPDAGQRGSGVLIARDETSAHAYLRESETDLLAQAFASGVEFGVFYARRPDAPHGEIISITQKQLATVSGDGVHTLEHLILADERAVCLADYYSHKNHDRLDDVPAAGEVVVLGDLGTHARGAIFLDACELLTPELTARIDAISHCFEGFYFGRYDLVAPSREALARGEGLRVIEVNGVTSESTHVYDPQHSALAGLRTFCAQWSLAFEIGAANLRRGAKSPSLFGLASEWLRYRRGQSEHKGG